MNSQLVSRLLNRGILELLVLHMKLIVNHVSVGVLQGCSCVSEVFCGCGGVWCVIVVVWLIIIYFFYFPFLSTYLSLPPYTSLLNPYSRLLPSFNHLSLHLCLIPPFSSCLLSPISPFLFRTFSSLSSLSLSHLSFLPFHLLSLMFISSHHLFPSLLSSPCPLSPHSSRRQAASPNRPTTPWCSSQEPCATSAAARGPSPSCW